MSRRRRRRRRKGLALKKWIYKLRNAQEGVVLVRSASLWAICSHEPSSVSPSAAANCRIASNRRRGRAISNSNNSNNNGVSVSRLSRGPVRLVCPPASGKAQLYSNPTFLNQTIASNFQTEQESRPTIESIPVGQSIDSAEYAAFESARSSTKSDTDAGPDKTNPSSDQAADRLAKTKATIFEEEEEEDDDDHDHDNNLRAETAAEQQGDDKENEREPSKDAGVVHKAAGGGGGQADQSKPEVEEAVIKIQALVRGHLTRKALKDAQQQAATPAPNALGQSQFDVESLTKNRK